MRERILIVDDESDICFVLKSVLCDNGYFVDSYDDPLVAVKNVSAYTENTSMRKIDIRVSERGPFLNESLIFVTSG